MSTLPIYVYLSSLIIIIINIPLCLNICLVFIEFSNYNPVNPVNGQNKNSKPTNVKRKKKFQNQNESLCTITNENYVDGVRR